MLPPLQIFVPPRAATLPPDVVEGWKRSMRFKQGVRVVGRNSLIATGVAALYYGIEAGASRARGGVVDAWNTAAGGAVAGGYLGVYGECVGGAVWGGRARDRSVWVGGRRRRQLPGC